MSLGITDTQHYSDIADAIRAKNGSADTYTPSEMATAIGDLPTPTTVTKGLVFSDYDSDGYPTKAEFVGTWTEIPQSFLYNLFRTDNFGKYITSITFPNTLTKIGISGVANCTALNQPITIPSSVTEILASGFNGCSNVPSFIFEGNPPATFPVNIFSGCNNCMLYDFSNATSIPSLYSTSSLKHKNDCVIKVPSALLSTWQTTAVWQDLTGVVWQGV